ncbi:MAG TPA: HAMP domain-containing sensor histidine kinase [Kofleriaceae bacterium]|nr:HAMP domain-containing sensor histidine kinase [Kofleriaceae bacterium]
MSGISIALDAVGGALVACSRDGAILGASPAAGDILTRMGGTSRRLPSTLWAQLENAPIGEAVIWSSTDSTGRILGCTRYPVGDDQLLLVMREITLQQELLAQQLQRHRAKTVEMLVFLLAHDLRAPLASIALNLDMLHDHWGEPGEDAFVRDSLDESLHAAAQLRETIDALVDLVRVGPPRAADLRVADIVERVVALTRPLFRHSGHELVVTLDPAASTIRANALGVQQILLNLLVNAVESTTQPMTVELTCACAVLDAVPAVRIRVRDHGPGIPPDVRSQLFQPFFTTKPTGTGLGLALARDAVVAEHGALELVDVDGGACFDVVLPAGGPL